MFLSAEECNETENDLEETPNQRAPSDRTLSVNSPHLAMLQSKNSSNIQGLAHILSKAKAAPDGGPTKFGQKMFKKKNSAGTAEQKNVQLKRNNLFSAKNGLEMVRTPSSGTQDNDLTYGQKHPQSFNSDDMLCPSEHKADTEVISRMITSADRANSSL